MGGFGVVVWVQRRLAQHRTRSLNIDTKVRRNSTVDSLGASDAPGSRRRQKLWTWQGGVLAQYVRSCRRRTRHSIDKCQGHRCMRHYRCARASTPSNQEASVIFCQVSPSTRTSFQIAHKRHSDDTYTYPSCSFTARQTDRARSTSISTVLQSRTITRHFRKQTCMACRQRQRGRIHPEGAGSPLQATPSERSSHLER